MVFDKLKSSGEHIKTVKSCIHDPGTGEVKIDADEVHVTQRVDQKNIEDVLTKALENVVSVTWSQIEDKHDSWNKSSKHINARFAAVVSIAVSLATAGYGAAFVGPLASTAGVSVTATEAALLSGFSAFIDAAVCVMSSRLAVNIIDAQGNVAKAWKESTKKNSIRSLLSNTLGCAITAGLIAGLNIETSAAQSIAEGFEESGIRILSATATRTLIEGESFEDALKGSILSISTDVLGKHLSREIGNAHKAGELNDFSHLGAHAVLGASMAAAKGGDFLSGGFGAVVGEIIAQHYRNVVDLDSLPPGGSLWKTLVDRGVDLSKLSTSLIAFLAGLDPGISADAAANAAKNNAFFVHVFYAAVGACTLYEGYEIYQTYKNEGPEAALEELALTGVVTIVTLGAGKVIYRVGKVAYPTAEAAFMACQAKSPTLTRVAESLSGTADKAKSLIDEIARMKDEGISKAGNLFGVKKSLDDIIKKSTPLPKKGGGTQQYKNSGGFNQANKDFDSLRLENIRSISLHGGDVGRVGLLPDGRKVVVRPRGSLNRLDFNSQPTLEIQNGPSDYTKIRY